MTTPFEALNAMWQGHSLELDQGHKITTFRIHLYQPGRPRLDWDTNDSNKGPGANTPLDTDEAHTLLTLFIRSLARGHTLTILPKEKKS